MKIETSIESVTPAKAESWLNLNKSNRRLRTGVVEKYAQDMRNGAWTFCPEPISFFDDSELADGQHRLWAIIESGMTVKCVIVRGLCRNDGMNINRGLARTLVDNARMTGSDTGLTNTLVSTCRGIAEGDALRVAISDAQKLAYVERHRDEAQWAIARVRHVRHLCNGPVLCAIARAHLVEKDEDRLTRFCTVLVNGFMEGESESAAIAMRNYLLSKAGVATLANNWRDTFLKAQNAVAYFMRGKRLTVIKSVADEAYPLKAARKAR